MNCHTLNMAKKQTKNNSLDVTAVVWNSQENTLVYGNECRRNPNGQSNWNTAMFCQQTANHGEQMIAACETIFFSVLESHCVAKRKQMVVKEERVERRVFKSFFLILSRKKIFNSPTNVYTKRSLSLYNSWKIVQQQTLSVDTVCTAGKL